MDKKTVSQKPQVKICGLTRVDEAIFCAESGADALGLVFYGKSPRNISDETARKITEALPETVASVGVFVNETYDFILDKIRKCGLTAVQLHGQEDVELVEKLKETTTVIKAVFLGKDPDIKNATAYNPSGFLVECGTGSLPGGNALEWDWSKASDISQRHPLILAGGLCADNIKRAVHSCMPDAIDISSGVESKPGRKDPVKVKMLMSEVFNCAYSEKNIRKIFI